MRKITYAELLRDPRWQKKRLEIMQRDNFTCRLCKATDKTLHVHHCYYEAGADPWDYPCDSLVTLCHECHDGESVMAADYKRGFIKLLSAGGCLGEDLLFLTHCVATSTLTIKDIIDKWAESIRAFEVGENNG